MPANVNGYVIAAEGETKGELVSVVWADPCLGQTVKQGRIGENLYTPKPEELLAATG